MLLNLGDIGFLVSVCDRNNPKFEINGILIDFDEGYAASTDTRRAIKIRSYENKGENTGQIIIPREIMSKLYSLEKDKRTDVEISVLNGMATAIVDSRIGKRGVVSDVISGKYPDIKRIIPKDFSTIYECEADMNFIMSVIGKIGLIIDFKYMKELSTYLNKFNDVGYVRIKANTKDEPFVVEYIYGGDIVFEYIIMPMIHVDEVIKKIKGKK